MPKKLIILSDMYGYDEDYIPDYLNYQIEGYACQQYDVSTLAEIDLNEDDIHLQYVEHGISKAVNKLLELENEVNTVIAFSVGGTIGWRAALKGLKLDHLIAVSSTRLRLENVGPECKTTLLFGENDQHKPSIEWSKSIDIQPITIPNAGHEMYKSKEIKIKLIALLSDSQ